MFRTKLFSSYFLLFSCFCHFLCCGIPLSLSILSLSTNAGLPYLLFSNISLESFEPVLLIISTLLLLILVLSEIQYKRNSCANNNCNDEVCDSKTKKIKTNIYLSSFLYFFNVLIFIIERY